MWRPVHVNKAKRLLALRMLHHGDVAGSAGTWSPIKIFDFCGQGAISLEVKWQAKLAACHEREDVLEHRQQADPGCQGVLNNPGIQFYHILSLVQAHALVCMVVSLVFMHHDIFG